MTQRGKLVGAILCLMAMSFFAALPFWKWFSARAVSATVQTRTRSLVEANSQLQPAWDVAMQDGVLTYPEAKVIVEAAGEKLDAE
ncbi:MAG: hypothetical protein AB7G28_18940 [Pirellulales bacterium]